MECTLWHNSSMLQHWLGFLMKACIISGSFSFLIKTLWSSKYFSYFHSVSSYKRLTKYLLTKYFTDLFDGIFRWFIWRTIFCWFFRCQQPHYICLLSSCHIECRWLFYVSLFILCKLYSSLYRLTTSIIFIYLFENSFVIKTFFLFFFVYVSVATLTVQN